MGLTGGNTATRTYSPLTIAQKTYTTTTHLSIQLTFKELSTTGGRQQARGLVEGGTWNNTSYSSHLRDLAC